MATGDAEMGKDDADEEEFAPAPETLDPFLVDLNARGLGPAEYALELVRKHTLNKQQNFRCMTSALISPAAWRMEPAARSATACGLAQGAPAKLGPIRRCSVLFSSDSLDALATSWELPPTQPSDSLAPRRRRCTSGPT